MPPRLPFSFARDHGVLFEPRDHTLAVRSNAKPQAVTEAARFLGIPFKARVVPEAEFEALVATLYGAAQAGENLPELSAQADLSALAEAIPESVDLAEQGDAAPVIRLINALLTRAVEAGASDIHLEPYESRSVTRFRIDGMLREAFEAPRNLHAALVSRIKIMASLDIAEKRLPQDGRIGFRLAGKPVDVRVSTLPTGPGERVVMRLLDKEAGRLSLSVLGLAPPVFKGLKALVEAPHGIVLATGPTGSGKTTTLYAALQQIDTARLNVMTVEDPIEYHLERIGQTQVNPRIDLTFARALRSILRQDPDVVMIGEIRDAETAQIAIQASLTGHLVLATLHTNDAAGAVTRLIDMGIEPFLLASSLRGVLAQRLVRKVCGACALRVAPNVQEQGDLRLLRLLEQPGQDVGTAFATVARIVGCAQCGHTGFRGRTGIYELLEVTEAIRPLIHDAVPEKALRDAAAYSTLAADGARWVRDGVTTPAELLRVVRES